MGYTVKVEPAHIREAQIAERATESDKTEPFYEYQSQPHDLPVIFVPLGLPIYRMANFRTRTAQQAYARREGKPADYFTSGEENEAAQQRQHEFLLKYANTGREGSVAPIIDVLKAERQRQPILITRRGVVVNGNRRLAAMRSLFEEDPNLYREFATVKCQLLPATATEKDIVEVEVRLQMKQRTELDYDWINECIAIREVCEGIIEIERDKRDGQMPLNLIQSANGKLSEVDMTRAAPGSLDAIGKQLDAVQANVDRLRGFLERQRAETTSGAV